MRTKTVAIIEDDPDIVELVQHHLEMDGLRVLSAADGLVGLDLIRMHRPELIILDLALPGLSGLEICRTLRRGSATTAVTILMLTAKGEETDIVLGLELGADDYVTKPFRVRELMARVHALLRRSEEGREPDRAVLKVGALSMDLEQHVVRVEDRDVSLTPAEFRLLQTLAARPGKVFTRDELVQAMTGGGVHIVQRNVDVHVRALRRKLESAVSYLQTVRGVGYKLVPGPAETDADDGGKSGKPLRDLENGSARA